MALFNYTALSRDESYMKGQIKAISQGNAVSKLEKEGFIVISIKKNQKFDLNKILSYSTINRIDKIYLTRHLHSFIEAGITLNEAIRIASEQIENKKLKEILVDIHEEILKGQRLSDSLMKYNNYFSNYFIKLISVGEQSGKLDETLEHLLEQQEKEYEILMKVKAALIYPIIILIAAFGILIFMMTFVVPTIATVLADYETQLPLATRILIASSKYLLEYGIFMLAFLIIFIYYTVLMTKKHDKVRRFFESVFFRMPVLKRLLKEYNIALFTRSMSAPLQSGLSVDASLKLALETCKNAHYRDSIIKTRSLVRKGIPLSEVLGGYSELYPPNVIRMIETGEKTGKIESMFKNLAIFHEKSISNTLSNISTIIEPFLLLIIGFLVGFLAVSILSPIWKLVETI